MAAASASAPLRWLPVGGLKAHHRPSTASLNPPNSVPEIIDSVCLLVSSRTRVRGEGSEPGIWGWVNVYLMFDVIWTPNLVIGL